MQTASSIPCRDSGASPAAGIHPLAVVPLLEQVEALPPDATGALIIGPEAAAWGIVLVECGRICWAAPTTMGRRLTEILCNQVEPPLNAEAVRRIYALCREKQLPFGETLVSEGLVSSEQLRRALRQHASEAMAVLSVRALPETRWVPHARPRYDARFSFGPAEVLVGVGALRDPDTTARARSILRRTLASGGSGVAYLMHQRSMLCPVGEVNADRLGVAGVVELGEWARDALDVAAAVYQAIGFVSWRTTAGAAAIAWMDGSVMYAAVLEDLSAHACAVVDRMRAVKGGR